MECKRYRTPKQANILIVSQQGDANEEEVGYERRQPHASRLFWSASRSGQPHGELRFDPLSRREFVVDAADLVFSRGLKQAA